LSQQPAVKLDHLSLRLWLRMLACTKLIENQIRSNLREQYGTTLPRFDLMAQLYRYPQGLRMGEISQLLMVTGGNITGITDQLEKEGLVERVLDPNDRRAYVAKLTPQGVTTFEAMAVQHHGWVNDLVDGLSDEEQQQLHELLTTLRDSLEEKLKEND
jgi:DNA-binding MarR family transcriptional regulator